MKIRRAIPPTAAPIPFQDMLYGIYGMVNKDVMENLETEFKEYFGTEHVFLVSSGKAALFLILSALRSLRDRTKVIIPAYTCYSVPSAVRRAGLKIIPCDIRPDSLDFDFEKLKSLPDDDTLCIVPTHLFGIPSDVERVKDVCRARGIFIVEDAAQALGVTVGEKRLGTLGDVAFFSLGRGKNITCGSGGIIATRSNEIADALRNRYGTLKREAAREYIVNIFSVILMSIFLRPYLYWFPQGVPFLKIGETKFHIDFPVNRLSGFKAGLLRHWRKALQTYNHGRSEIGDFYLKELNLERSLPIYSRSVPYLRFPAFVSRHRLTSDSCEHFRFLGVTRMYPDSVNNIEELRSEFDGTDFGNSETIAQTILTLPTHSFMRDRDRMKVCRMVKDLMNQ